LAYGVVALAAKAMASVYQTSQWHAHISMASSAKKRIKHGVVNISVAAIKHRSVAWRRRKSENGSISAAAWRSGIARRKASASA